MLSFVYNYRITTICRFVNSHRKTDVCPAIGYTEYVATSDNSRASTGDRRVRRTRASLQRALIELVAEQDLSEIGVADVVDRADVSRSTFYDHYQDVHELAEDACASMIDDLLASLTAVDPAPAKSSDPQSDPSPALTAFFTHFAEHAALYRSLLGPTGSARVIEHLRLRTTEAARLYPRLPATDDSPERGAADPADASRDVPAAFVAGALLGVATDWLQRGCPRPPREMTILTEPLLTALRNSTATANAS
jgi:AcrR family transcriptional regulator